MNSSLKRYAIFSLLSLCIGTITIYCAYGFPQLRATRCNQCGLQDYRYGHDAAVAADSLIAIAPADQPESIIQVSSVDKTGKRQKQTILRKVFPTPVNSLLANDVTLNRIALVIYSSGKAACTGKLTFDGGPQGALLGANIIVRVRAYSSTPQNPSGLENARLLWETATPLWISRNQSKATSLLPTCCKLSKNRPVSITSAISGSSRRDMESRIRLHFEETTHLEIVLEHYEDK